VAGYANVAGGVGIYGIAQVSNSYAAQFQNSASAGGSQPVVYMKTNAALSGNAAVLRVDPATTSTIGILIQATAAPTNTQPALSIKKDASGSGRGIDLLMGHATSSDAGIVVSHSGLGIGQSISLTNTSNVNPGLTVSHVGDAVAINAQNTSTTSTQAVGFFNQSSTSTNTGASALTGQSSSVRGGAFYASAANSNTVALYAEHNFSSAHTNDAIGVYGKSIPSSGHGYGVYGEGLKFGVYANGDVGASGTKPFVIDHPLDPENKILKHFALESPEVLNVYRGNIELDNSGEATVHLPAYFQAINKEFSYVLTPIGAPANLYVKKEIDGTGTFTIAGGHSGQKISWYVYADRNDLYLQKYPEKRNAEVQKDSFEVGKYIRPDLYDQPKEKGIFFRGDYKPLNLMPVPPVLPKETAEPIMVDEKK
jgi:hypothetical protein